MRNYLFGFSLSVMLARLCCGCENDHFMSVGFDPRDFDAKKCGWSRMPDDVTLEDKPIWIFTCRLFEQEGSHEKS